MSSVFFYLSCDLRGAGVGFFQLWSRLWGPAVNPLLCQGAYLRRLLSHHTFVALWARVRGRALRTSQRDATLTDFLTPA